MIKRVVRRRHGVRVMHVPSPELMSVVPHIVGLCPIALILVLILRVVVRVTPAIRVGGVVLVTRVGGGRVPVIPIVGRLSIAATGDLLVAKAPGSSVVNLSIASIAPVGLSHLVILLPVEHAVGHTRHTGRGNTGGVVGLVVSGFGAGIVVGCVAVESVVLGLLGRGC